MTDFRSAGIRFQPVHVGAVGQAVEAVDGALPVGTTVVRAVLAQAEIILPVLGYELLKEKTSYCKF